MKTIKSILTLFALVAVFSPTAIAQVGTAEVNATATVYSTLELDFSSGSNSDEINFGGLLKGNYTATVQSDGSQHSNVGQDASPATGTITADNGAEIYIEYSENVIMENDNSNQLILTPTLSVGSTTISASGTTFSMGADPATVVVGGSMTLTDATPDGTYTSSSPIVITFNYN